MARITNIQFSSVDKMHGCTCDRCGQWIRNIVSVSYDDGLTLNYGQDCFDKLSKGSRLTTYGMKLLKKTMKSLKYYQGELEKYQSGEYNEENDNSYLAHQPQYRAIAGWYEETYWTGKPYSEYKTWMIEKCLPERIKGVMKELKRFEKVNFKRGTDIL